MSTNPMAARVCTECDQPVQITDTHKCKQCKEHCEIAMYLLRNARATEETRWVGIGGRA